MGTVTDVDLQMMLNKEKKMVLTHETNSIVIGSFCCYFVYSTFANKFKKVLLVH